MNTLDYLFSLEPYSLDKQAKKAIFNTELKALTQFHMSNCKAYDNMLQSLNFDLSAINDYEKLPFIPVGLFKILDLKSIPISSVFKTLTSSGTSGQSVSKIYIDKNTAFLQQRALVNIISSFTESKRLPMLIIDCPSVIKNKFMYSARGAGILGFSIFGTDLTYALDDEMKLNIEAIESFLSRHHNQKILLFGFTFMVWQHFYKELQMSNIRLDLSRGILIHGGGWKKLISEAVSRDEFKHRFIEQCGLSNIHEYYGMVEQTGCIYIQCEYGHLHASNFSDIIIRDPLDFSILKFGEKGLVQVVSLLAKSYPGHSLLTEDEGILLGEDDCPCGRKGKYFTILGRLKNAEIRGCSDTYATNF